MSNQYQGTFRRLVAWQSAKKLTSEVCRLANQYRRNGPKNPNSPNAKGFSLVELLVVISIVALLSAGAVLGFGNLGTTLRAKEVAGFLGDSVRLAELKVLRGDLSKARIHFLRDYLVIEEWAPKDVDTLSLQTDRCLSVAGADCEIKALQNGNLIQKNADGEVVAVSNVPLNSVQTIPFKGSNETERGYQLKTDGGAQSSALFRFVHFNLQQGLHENYFTIGTNAGKILEIQSPYGKKRYFSSSNAPDTEVQYTFPIHFAGESVENVTLP